MRGPKRRFSIAGLLLALGLLLQLAAARQPAAVERVFARWFYPAVGARLGCLSGGLPFSAAEGLALVLVLWTSTRLVRALRRRPLRSALADVAAGVVLAVACFYVAFLLLWGLNYQRLPFADSAGLPVRPSNHGELVALGEATIADANAAREGLLEDGQGVTRLRDGRGPALDRTEAGFRAAAALYPFLAGRCARPKPLLTSVAFSWLGITGIYVPFTGEPSVNMTQPEFEVPFAASHEVAHQRGFAREDEANYVGYLACRLHPDADFRYSGRLAASVYVMNALAAADREAWIRLGAHRSEGVRRDLQALLAWAERYRGPAERISHRVNDAYLKSQGQAAGVRSYGRVVDLLLAERRAAGPD